jgi:hypothetical protein
MKALELAVAQEGAWLKNRVSASFALSFRLSGEQKAQSCETSDFVN